MSISGRRLQRGAQDQQIDWGTNLLTGKVFTSDVPEDWAGSTISLVTDGSRSTRWISQQTSPVNITADLQNTYDLSRVVIVFAADTIRNYTVSVSTTGSTWTQIASGQTNNTLSQTIEITNFSSTPKGRYLRITGTDRWNNTYGNSIWEVEAYGQLDSSQPSGTITNFIGTAASTTQINLTWNYSGSALTNYTLRRNGSVIASPAAGATSYNDTGLAAGTTYNYSLVANYQAGGTSNTATDAATTSSSGGGGGSGEAMPNSNLPGWTLKIAQDFNADVTLGNFRSVYGGEWDGYNTWEDTSRDLGRPAGRRGVYSATKTVTVQNSVLDVFVHTEGLQPYVFALTPPNSGQLYGRYAVRFKSEQVTGYKVAWLLWPTSNIWEEGEIDFPEGDLGQEIEGYSHDVNGNPAANAWSISTGQNMLTWHTCVIEWTPTVLRYILDGTVYQTTNQAAIPKDPMRWCLQTETWLSSTPPPTNTSGHVQIDWVAMWSYTP